MNQQSYGNAIKYKHTGVQCQRRLFISQQPTTTLFHLPFQQADPEFAKGTDHALRVRIATGVWKWSSGIASELQGPSPWHHGAP